MNHKIFGKLNPLDEISYEGQLKLNDKRCKLYIECKENGHEETIASLSNLKPILCDLELVAKEYASTNLIELKNQTWLEDDEREISSNEFINRIELESIIMYHDRSMSFTYTDDDIFYGHWIVVDFDENQKPIDADIAG